MVYHGFCKCFCCEADLFPVTFPFFLSLLHLSLPLLPSSFLPLSLLSLPLLSLPLLSLPLLSLPLLTLPLLSLPLLSLPLLSLPLFSLPLVSLPLASLELYQKLFNYILVLTKVLKLLQLLVEDGHVEFKQNLRKQPEPMKEAASE